MASIFFFKERTIWCFIFTFKLFSLTRPTQGFVTNSWSSSTYFKNKSLESLKLLFSHHLLLFKKHSPPLTFSSVLSRFIQGLTKRVVIHYMSFWVLTPLKNWPPLTEKSPLFVTLSPTSQVLSLKIGGNCYYHSPFPNKNMWLTYVLTHSLTGSLTPTHSLTHPATHPLTHSLTHLERMGETIITVVCPKQKIVVFINFYNFNFVVFSLLI